ncbi:VOC family protein [Sinorhizobium meliloti]|uniref:Ring-cleaving dioxygenase n=1 Tax=Rhizobium meliloti TaxID=382 RepID=A0A2J0YTB3_RHIML|nr:VOC family protein [Sinorhizobium meliloti]PJR09107.1 ring-cleaving dioxygenase [Sinorhizobium meliloti]
MVGATVTRRDILMLAGVATAAAALPASLRAEGLDGASKAEVDSLPFALKTPVHIEQVSLRVMDLPMMARYYNLVLGLEEIEASRDYAILGAGGVPLLSLRQVDGIVREHPASAGLYHVAYLMPTRADLARWLVHAAMLQVPIDGFADHDVSEAIYLTDPEGNGIEVYSDRSPENWIWTDGFVTMGTKAIDLDGLVALTDRTRDTYSMPSTLRIGHIHLRVGDLAAAEAFYGNIVGLQSTRKGRKDAAFYSSGGYHHHLGMNVWNSRGAGKRAAATTGLEWFLMRLDAESMKQARTRAPAGQMAEVDGGFSLTDPWGTEIRMIG